MRISITGHTRGLGKDLFNHYKNLKHDVVGFNSDNSIEEIVKLSKGSDLFINNAYTDDNLQLKLLHALKSNVKKMIVIGSVATINPDYKNPIYTLNKRRLELDFNHIAIDKIDEHADLLLLNLTSSSYKDRQTLINTIDFWLHNPTITTIAFRVD